MGPHCCVMASEIPMSEKSMCQSQLVIYNFWLKSFMRVRTPAKLPCASLVATELAGGSLASLADRGFGVCRARASEATGRPRGRRALLVAAGDQEEIPVIRVEANSR